MKEVDVMKRISKWLTEQGDKLDFDCSLHEHTIPAKANVKLSQLYAAGIAVTGVISPAYGRLLAPLLKEASEGLDQETNPVLRSLLSMHCVILSQALLAIDFIVKGEK